MSAKKCQFITYIKKDKPKLFQKLYNKADDYPFWIKILEKAREEGIMGNEIFIQQEAYGKEIIIGSDDNEKLKLMIKILEKTK